MADTPQETAPTTDRPKRRTEEYRELMERAIGVKLDEFELTPEEFPSSFEELGPVEQRVLLLHFQRPDLSFRELGETLGAAGGNTLTKNRVKEILHKPDVEAAYADLSKMVAVKARNKAMRLTSLVLAHHFSLCLHAEKDEHAQVKACQAWLEGLGIFVPRKDLSVATSTITDLPSVSPEETEQLLRRVAESGDGD